jgi:putative endonuclease
MKYRQKVGKFGEILAKNYLIKHGYKIVDCNVKISYQEIDIVANFKEKIVFVEVKTMASSTFGLAEDNITSRKIQNLKKAIDMYINSKNLDPENIRLDLISIDIDRNKKIAKIKHYRDLF